MAVALLLLINLFNYIDRYVLAAVESQIEADFFPVKNDDTMAKMGSLATAFLVSYMLAAPIFGWLADRMSRWLLVAIGVILWSLASGGSGLAGTFGVLLITRMLVGVGEAGYGPAAPTLIADMYPVERRGAVLAWFYMAIPVGSALGYVLGGFVAQHWGWRMAFYAVVPPGILLGVWALLMRDPPRGQSDAGSVARKATWADYAVLLRTPSYVLDTLGMTALTFAIGGISFWMPRYLHAYRNAGTLEHVNIVFGGITVVAGIAATLLGGMAGDALRNRFPGSYFLVSAAGIWTSCPLVVLMLWTPFPYAWVCIFFAVFFLFFNTGPSNAILANVTHPSIRASAFAVNILVIHALGDAISPPLLGKIVGPVDGVFRWNLAFLVVAAVMALAGAAWLWGAKYLARDTELAPTRLGRAPSGPDVTA
jgi:MFS family permease